jgi:hypothetical protein
VPIDIELILSCLRQNWLWQLGDNHPLGWSITAGYAVATALAALVVLRAPFAADTRGRERVFWVLVMLFLLFMTINKQLNLQTTLREAGRCVSQVEGWYRTRGAVQEQFVLWLTGALALTGLAMLWWMRKALLRNLPALTGCTMLAFFILVRAADIANVQRLVRWEFLEIGGHRWLELAGIAFVLAGAMWILRQGGHARGRGTRRRAR